jgi:hypothetical protein
MSWADIVKNPETHPHYGEYTQLCKAANLSPKFIKESWRLIITGLEVQAGLRARKAHGVPNLAFIMLGELVAQDAERLMMPRRMGTPLALWSGGLDVSKFVRKKGHDTLESTVFGHILDLMTNPKFKIWLGSSEWGPQGALWNIISAEYVKVAAAHRDTMHVYMRTHDLDSVFYREELVNWQKAKGKRPDEVDGLTYHILIGMDSFHVEKVFSTEMDAKLFLFTFFAQMKQEFGHIAVGKEVNHRLRSEVWRDNVRAVDDTFFKDVSKTGKFKTQEEKFQAYLDAVTQPRADLNDEKFKTYVAILQRPHQDIVKTYVEAAQAISAPIKFDPKQFSKVMAEVRSRGKT